MATLVENLFRLSEVAQASYVRFSDSPGAYSLADREFLVGRLANPADTVAGSNYFAVTQAQNFLNPQTGFTLLHHTPNDSVGFSASLFRDNESGKLVFATRGTEPDFGGPDLFDADADIALYGIAPKQIVAMYNYIQRLKTPAGQDVVELIYEEFGMPPTDGRTYMTLRPTLVAPNGVVIPGRYISLTPTTANGAGLGVMSAADIANGITITGHSLGGHLAIAASRLFPSLTTDVVTFDSAGFKPNFADEFFALFPGAAASFDEAKVTNVYGSDGIEFTTNDFFHDQAGKRISIAIEPRMDTPIDQHVIPNVTDMLAIYQLLGRLDSQLADGSRMEDIETIVRASNSKSELHLESMLDALRAVFLGQQAVKAEPTVTEDKNSFYDHLYALEDNATFQTVASTGTQSNAVPGRVVSLAFRDAAWLVNDAGSEFGYFFALVNVAPLAVINADTVYQSVDADLYARWQADQSLPEDEREFTAQWYGDRAVMLLNKLETNYSEGSIVDYYSAQESRRFVDYDTMTAFDMHRPEDLVVPDSALPQTVFGFETADAGSAALLGDGLSDHLYGEGGNDELHGQGGDDYLEGGQGNDQLFGDAANDTLVGGAGNDELTGGVGSDRLEGGRGVDTYQFSALDLRDSSTDTIRDVDGQGVIKIDGVALNAVGAKALSSNVWELADRTRIFLISNQSKNGVPSDTLLIKKPGHDGSYIKIENFHQGDFGLTLQDYPQGQRAINSDLSTAADYSVLQSAANISLDLSSGVRSQLIAGGSDPQSYSALSATQADTLLSQYDIVYQYANDESGFSATVFKDNVTGQFVLSFRGTEFEPNRVDAYAKDTKLGALGDINREGFTFGQIVSMERLTGHLLNGETLNRVTGEWEPNAALQGFRDEAYGGRLIVTGDKIVQINARYRSYPWRQLASPAEAKRAA